MLQPVRFSIVTEAVVVMAIALAYDRVVSATPALAEETKVESIKAEETTTEEVATPPPAAKPEKETDTTVTPEEPVTPEPQAPVAEAETKGVVVEEAELATKVESSPMVAPEPVQVEKVKGLELSDVPEIEPEPESESVTEAPKDEVGGEEEKPAEGEYEVGNEAPVENTDD